MRKRRHVVPTTDGKWAVKKPGSDRASSIQSTQAAAIEKSKRILGNIGGGECVIHNTKGQIRDADTVHPGNDPFPPKG